MWGRCWKGETRKMREIQNMESLRFASVSMVLHLFWVMTRLINWNCKNKNWLTFLLIVKAAVLKQQISKFYPQIQRTENSDHILFQSAAFRKCKSYLLCLEFADKIFIFAVLERRLLQWRETEASFCIYKFSLWVVS